jgi:hypothetical protein
LGSSKECLLELGEFRRRKCLILLDLFSKASFRSTFVEMGINTDGSERFHDVGIGDVKHAEGVGAQLSHGIPSEFAGQNNAKERVEMMVRFGQGQDGSLNFLSLVFGMLRITSPGDLNERCRLADRRVRASSLEDVIYYPEL